MHAVHCLWYIPTKCCYNVHYLTPKDNSVSLSRQIIILAGVGRGGGHRMSLGVDAPNQAWAQRVEVMQLEMAALMQRTELLNAELVVT